MKTKRITLINTGGTISMEKSSDNGVDIRNGKLIIERMLDSMTPLATIKSLHFISKPSPHITLEDMLALRKLIKTELENDLVDGIVVTHGTDTLEETAYFMDLTLNTNKPIVFTGSMRNTGDLGFDGPANLASAIKTAASDDAENAGVLIVLNDIINPAQSTTKTHTSKLGTFESTNFGALGMVDGDKVIFYRENHLVENKFEINSVKKSVIIIKAFSDMPSEIFTALSSLNVDGIILEGFGRGNVPPTIVDQIESIIKNGKPIVITSRCFRGNVSPTYSYYGGGLDLKNKGVIFAGSLDSQKARLKLLVALENEMNLEEIEKYFESNIY